MLTVLSWIIFLVTSLINLIIFAVIWEMPGLTKNDWYFVTISALGWFGSATYLFGFF